MAIRRATRRPTRREARAGGRGLRRWLARTCACLALLLPGCVTIELPGGLPEPLVETVVYGETGPKILLVQLDGVLTAQPASGSFFGPGESRVARLREELDRARKDPAIRALLLRIDSPGGTASASDVMYGELMRFKQERGIPVIAQFMGVAASGGYYVAQAADHIVAQPTAVTGSIGVIFGGVNLTGLMEKIGVENQTLVSGPYKDAGSMLRRMTPEERAQLQTVLDDLFARFLVVVGSGRPKLAPETVDRLADGRIYSAAQALENGLIDEVGGIAEAVAAAERAAGLPSARVVSYHRHDEFRSNVFSASAPERADVRASADWRQLLPGPTFLYLWTPGMF